MLIKDMVAVAGGGSQAYEKGRETEDGIEDQVLETASVFLDMGDS